MRLKNYKKEFIKAMNRICIFGVFAIILLAFFINGCEDLFLDSKVDEEGKQYILPQNSLVWSPNGAMIAFISMNKVLVMDVDTGNQRQLTGTGYYSEPTWSPDSDKVAYVSSPMDFRASIWTKKADGSDVAKQITSNNTSDYRPRWSPDGTKIAFHSRRLNNTDIWIVNADSAGEQIAIASDKAVDQDAEWSPDSTKLAFESLRVGNYDIWVARIDGSTPPLQITTNSGADTNPLWSPDGSKIAFQSNRDGVRGIWVKNSDGTGNAIAISEGFSGTTMHHWSPDSKMIAFVVDKVIYAMKADGTGEAIKVTDGFEPNWSPDGKRMAIVRWVDTQYKVQVIDLSPELIAEP